MDGIKSILPGLRQRNDCVCTARTEDDIGYIMIATLSRSQTKQLVRKSPMRQLLTSLPHTGALLGEEP